MFLYLLCLTYPYQLSKQSSSQIVVDATPLQVMGYPVTIRNTNVSLALDQPFDAFESIDLGNGEYKFFVTKSSSDAPEIDTNNQVRSFTPLSLGTYYVGLMHATGYARVTVERAIVRVRPNQNCRFDESSYASYEDPTRTMTYRDIVLATYVYLDYLDASSDIGKRVAECADVDESGTLEFRDLLLVTYFYLGYLTGFPTP